MPAITVTTNIYGNDVQHLMLIACKQTNDQTRHNLLSVRKATLNPPKIFCKVGTKRRVKHLIQTLNLTPIFSLEPMQVNCTSIQLRYSLFYLGNRTRIMKIRGDVTTKIMRFHDPMMDQPP